MGCDIHLHVEFKVRGMWLHYSHPRISRNYELFAKMAGVRAYDDEVKPLCYARGLPADISATTMFDVKVRWKADAHNYSWLGRNELVELQKWFEKQSWASCFEDTFGFFFGSTLDASKETWPTGVEDVRVVFWFDN